LKSFWNQKIKRFKILIKNYKLKNMKFYLSSYKIGSPENQEKFKVMTEGKKNLAYISNALD
jgi:hypothetical protein